MNNDDVVLIVFLKQESKKREKLEYKYLSHKNKTFVWNNANLHNEN